jgi:hypothetical protein
MHRDVGALFTFGETVYVPDGIWAGEGGSKSAREQQHFGNYLLACASERASARAMLNLQQTQLSVFL